MAIDKITGSTLLPDQLLTQKVDTGIVQIGDEFFNKIDQVLIKGDPRAIPSSKAVFEIIMALQQALDDIDPNNNFFRDNSVISQALVSPTFNTLTDWELNNWIIDQNKAIYSYELPQDGNNNWLRLPTERIPAAADYFIRLDIDRIDSGRLELRNAAEEVIETFDIHGTHYLTYTVENADIDSFKIVSIGQFPNQASVISYFGLFKISDRFKHYMNYILANYAGGGSGGGDFSADIAQLKQAVQALATNHATDILDLIDRLAIHVNNWSNPHRVTREQLRAAAEVHTHSLDDLGAAPIVHTHTPQEVGAAPEVHGHTPIEVGAAPANHTHIPAAIGAADRDHNHDGIYTDVETFDRTIDNINSILASLNFDPASPVMASGGGTDLNPLTVLGAVSNLGHELISPKNTQQSSLFSQVELATGEIYQKPITTLKSNTFLHSSNGCYDIHNGTVTVYSRDTNVTLNGEFPSTTNLRIVDLEGIDIVRHKLDYVNTNSRMDFTKLVPVFSLPISDSAVQLDLEYIFHTRKKIIGYNVYRRMDNSISSTLAGSATTDYSITHFAIKDLAKQVIQNVVLTVTEWGSNDQIFVPVTTPYEAGGFYISLSYANAKTPESTAPLYESGYKLFSFAIVPVFEGDAKELTLTSGNSFIGHCSAISVENSPTIQIPKEVTIPSWMMDATNFDNNLNSYGVVYLSETVPATIFNDYKVEVNVSSLPVEYGFTSPKGFPVTKITRPSVIAGIEVHSTSQPIDSFLLVDFIKSDGSTVTRTLFNANNTIASNNLKLTYMLTSLEHDVTSYTCYYRDDPTGSRISKTIAFKAGLFYDRNDNTLTDYENNTTPVCILGHFALCKIDSLFKVIALNVMNSDNPFPMRLDRNMNSYTEITNWNRPTFIPWFREPTTIHYQVPEFDQNLLRTALDILRGQHVVATNVIFVNPPVTLQVFSDIWK